MNAKSIHQATDPDYDAPSQDILTKGWLHVIHAIHHAPGLNLTQLVERASIPSKATVKGCVLELVARGVVEVSVNPPPEESYRIELTPRGERIAEHADHIFELLEGDEA